MKSKLLNFSLIITSLFGYLEWGKKSHSFLFQVEFELFSKLFTDPIAALHPFTILPLLGQGILLITLFQKTPDKTWTFIGMGGLAVLLLFMLFIGLLSSNIKIIISTLPFLLVSFLTIRNYRK